MRLLVINPNTNAELTEKLCAIAAAAVPDASVEGATAPFGVDYIRTRADGETALRALEALADELAAGPDAAMIASSSDTGLALMRRRLDIPVTAMTESAMKAASMLADGFSVISFQPESEIMARGLADLYGVAGHLKSVRVPVILETGGSDDLAALKAAILDAGAAAIAEDGAGVLLVGGAAACPITAELTRELGVPVLDGVRCAARQAQMLAGLAVPGDR